MATNPAVFGFSMEYRGDDSAQDGLDEYLRIEFPERHPGWEPRFGKMSFFDRITNRHDYAYLITGDVPEAESHADAEGKVAHLLEEIARDFKALRPEIKSELPNPITRVWPWHH